MPSRRTRPVFALFDAVLAGLAALVPAQPVSAAPPNAKLAASIVRLLILFIEFSMQSQRAWFARPVAALDSLLCEQDAIGAWFCVLVQVQTRRGGDFRPSGRHFSPIQLASGSGMSWVPHETPLASVHQLVDQRWRPVSLARYGLF
ncbi:MAG: hypothetical protein WDO74_11770 [Pseudomonadota bacterium]